MCKLFLFPTCAAIVQMHIILYCNRKLSASSFSKHPISYFSEELDRLDPPRAYGCIEHTFNKQKNKVVKSLCELI